MSQEKVKEFYANDIVYRFDKSKKIIFGVVLDSYEASNDDTDDVNSLQKGQIRVSWSNTSREQIWRQSKVIEHVSSDRLKNVRPFDVDDAVSCGDIFGRIESIDQLVTMRSIDGSVVELLTSMNNDFDDYWLSKRGGLLSMEVYYPGQEVVGVPANFVRPTWIKKTKTMKRNMQQRQRFTIQEVNDAMIEVALHSNISGYSHISEIMNEDIKKLQVLEHPSDTALELMDRRLLKLNSHDILLRKKDWVRKLSIMHRPEAIRVRHNLNCNSKNTIRVPRIRSSSLLFSPSPTKIDCDKPPVFPGVDDAEDDWWTEEGEESEEENTECGSNPSSKATSVVMPKPVPRKKHYPPRPCELTAGNTLAVEVVSVESKITVVWQDGTEEKDIPSTQLYYNISIDDHEFFPGEWVVKSSAGKDSFGDGKHGVIQRVDYMERTATVKWFQTSQAGKPPLFINSEELSVYDLKKHFKYIYRPGSIVKANPSVDGKIGKVIDSCIDGYVIVEWQQGKLENCWPESIELLPDRSDYAYSDSDESTADLATESIATPLISTPLPSVPATPDESVSITNSLKIKNSTSSDKLMDVQLDKGAKWYISVEEAPVTHHYFTSKFEPGDTQKFLKSVVKEYALLKESLPADVWVCSYGNRLDLLSVMIRGPAKTPYEDGLFLFDIQLSADYPRSPPLVHYISYSSERLNPNLYVEGKVCVSLLGTWMGKGTEVWGPDSTLLQLIVSIQGLILVSEPYYNEAGYEKQTDSQQGYENSRTYNELVILKLVQSMTELLLNPPAVFHEQVLSHFAQNGEKLCQRLETFWRDQDPLKPDFPLLPVSKGLILSLSSAIKHFRDVLERKTSSKSSEANPVSSSEQKIEL
ncbi:hypothetical protein YQE_01917, partial [Dendroctonus ponderosae]